MSAFGNLVVRDDAATPVDYTLYPTGSMRLLVPSRNAALAEWAGANSAVPDKGQLRASSGRDLLKSGDKRTWFKFEVPVMEVASGTTPGGYAAAPAVAHTLTFIMTAFTSPRATQQEKQNAMRLVLSALCGATATAGAGQNPNSASGNLYGGTAAAHEIFVKGIFPS